MRLFTFDSNDFECDLINLTKHSIFISSSRYDDIVYEVKPSGIVTRVEKVEFEPCFKIRKKRHNKTAVGHDINIRVYSHQPGRVINLPEVKERTYYIVSAITAKAVAFQYPNRRDILTPDSKHLRKMRANGELPTVFRLLQHKPLGVF